MDDAFHFFVRERAGNRCEYCRLKARLARTPFQIEHIIAKQHRGQTTAENTAYACIRCNKHKGPNLAGVDPETCRIVPLFHPRQQDWEDHFEWDGPFLRGQTPAGRATIEVLAINHPDRVAMRRELIEEFGPLE